MLIAHRKRHTIERGLLATDAPYAERAARKESRLDGALLGAWGRASPHLLSALARDRLRRFARQVEKQETQLASLPDRRLREVAEELRPRLLSAMLPSPEMAVPMTRRDRLRRNGSVPLLGHESTRPLGSLDPSRPYW